MLGFAADEAREGLCGPWEVIEDDAREASPLKANDVCEKLKRGNEQEIVGCPSLDGIWSVLLARVEEM